MDKRFWAIIGIIVVVFGGILFLNNHKSSNSGSSSSNAQPTNHIKGNTSSKVTLLEYGDYQCPVCESYFPVVQQVQQKYNDTVKFQFRNLPLIQVHQNALAAARAAEAASLQGKFWEMHDMLYTNQNWNDWTQSNVPATYFNTYAQQLNLNLTQFKKDFASSAVNATINADIEAFQKTGQQEATPTFFVNGKYVANSNFVDSNGPSIDAFSKVLDQALKDAGQK